MWFLLIIKSSAKKDTENVCHSATPKGYEGVYLKTINDLYRYKVKNNIKIEQFGFINLHVQ